MPFMKKISYSLAAASLLLLFASCESVTNDARQNYIADSIVEEYPVEEHLNATKRGPTAETEEAGDYEYSILIEEELEVEEEYDESAVLYEIKAVLDHLASFTSTWAKTDTHFFFCSMYFRHDYDDEGYMVTHPDFALYRLPLDNIAQGERIALPTNGWIEIVGVNEQYLFVSIRSGDQPQRNFDTYRISLSTLHVTWIDSGIYYGVPFLHLATNSILFAHGNLDDRIVWLEYLQLDTGERHTFYELETNNFYSDMGWLQMEEGAITFVNSIWGGAGPGSDFILIDSELQARQIQYDDIDMLFMWQIQPQNPAEKFVHELGSRSFVTIEDRVYYLDGRYHNLYRINLDDTQNILLQDDIDFRRLFSINNTLLATIFPRPHRGYDSSWYEAVALAGDGSIAKVLGGGWHGHNAAFGMQQLVNTDMVMVMQFSFFGIDGEVLGLYCTSTGALFNPSAP